MAVSKTDQYDFLIDIVPRDDVKPHKKEELGRLPLVDPQLLFMQPVRRNPHTHFEWFVRVMIE